MKEAFLITNSNINLNAGNTTLIMRRAESLYLELNIFTHIFLYKRQAFENFKLNYCCIHSFFDRHELLEEIIKHNPRYIIVYGDKMNLLIPSLLKLKKKNNLQFELILDVQSAIEEKKEYAGSLLEKLVVYPLRKILFSYAINHVDSAFVVTDELMQNCNNKIKNRKKDIKYFKVRCGISSVLTENEICVFRNKFRNEYHIKQDDIVFCFSGFRSKWQKIDEIVEQFKIYDAKLNNAFFAFFCNSDEKFEMLIKNAFPKNNYLIMLLDKQDYFNALCACDIGFLIRDYNETNRVAFPNKFSDYCNAGLIIAINDSLPEPFRILKQNSVPCLSTDAKEIDNNISLILSLNRNSFINLSRKLCYSELLYSNQIKRL